MAYLQREEEEEEEVQKTRLREFRNCLSFSRLSNCYRVTSRQQR